jgi:tetratricopeptide (TPR) repeat protein
MSREKGCVLFLLFALTLAVTSDAWAQRRKKSKPAGATPAGETSSGSATTAKSVSEASAPELERAEKFYQLGNYYSASIEFNKTIEGEGAVDPGAKMRAEFMMGKTLFKLKFFSASLSYFDRIVQKGPAHPNYNETLQWLASLTHQPVDTGIVLEKIGKYNRQELEAPQLEAVRDELYFLLGKYNYNKGKFQEAISLFNLVPAKSAFYPQAKLFEGATYVRQYTAKPAVEAFKAVLLAAEESQDPKVRPFQDLANLSLARVFYSTGQFKMATKYFDRVSPESYDWPNSLFEASWANFMLKQEGYSKALGDIHTLRAPFFEYFVKPESVAEALTVKATIYFYNCLFERAANSIQEFNDWVPQVAEGLAKALTGNPANDQFYALAVKIRSGKSGLPPAVERAARAVLSDRSLVRRFDAIRELDRELVQLERAEASWRNTTVATNLNSEIGVTRALAVNEAGEIARKRVERLVNEFRVLITRVIKIEYEILQGEKGTLEEDVKSESQSEASGRSRDISNVRIDDEHEFWPFMGEYWRDELGYYRYKLLNKCVHGTAGPEGAPASGGQEGAVPEGGETPAPESAAPAGEQP